MFSNFCINLAFRKEEFYGSIDQNNYHKIPLNPSLPVFDREKITKGGSVLPPFGKGRWGGILTSFSNSSLFCPIFQLTYRI
ncbi:MAG: hypothetical protein FJ110_03480 [Deltaproteobacteria bacterium]|nr:hypothetical protein [Deltaproteobacteria bacterium]